MTRWLSKPFTLGRGTHVDAPFHFYQPGATVEKLSLAQLIACARVVHTQGADVTPAAILQHEAEHGELPRGCILLCSTGWAERYSSGPKLYLGFDERVDGPFDPLSSELSFPGVTRAAAELLVERGVAAVGIDTASLVRRSIVNPMRRKAPVDAPSCGARPQATRRRRAQDPGWCKSFDSHRVLLSAGIYGIENLSPALAQLPPRGATLCVMPLKLSGGTGAPSRVVAFLPPPGWRR